MSGHEHCVDPAFDRIEQDILPGLSMMLDTLLDASALARPGVDAAVHAAELRRLGVELESLTRQLDSFAISAGASGTTRARSAA